MRRRGLALRSHSVARAVRPDPRAASEQRQEFVREASIRQLAIRNEQRQKAELKRKLEDKKDVSASLGKIHACADRSMKEIASLRSELNEARAMNKEYEERLECRKQELRVWKEEASGRQTPPKDQDGEGAAKVDEMDVEETSDSATTPNSHL